MDSKQTRNFKLFDSERLVLRFGEYLEATFEPFFGTLTCTDSVDMDDQVIPCSHSYDPVHNRYQFDWGTVVAVMSISERNDEIILEGCWDVEDYDLMDEVRRI